MSRSVVVFLLKRWLVALIPTLAAVWSFAIFVRSGLPIAASFALVVAPIPLIGTL